MVKNIFLLYVMTNVIGSLNVITIIYIFYFFFFIFLEVMKINFKNK